MAELTDAELDDLIAALGLTKSNPRGGSQRKPIAHGEYRGYKQHIYRREEPCETCLQASRDYQRNKKASTAPNRRKPVNKPISIPIDHGTIRGYRQHLSLVEPLCGPCRQAYLDAKNGGTP